LTAADTEFVKKVGRLLAVLPEPGRKLQCTISFPSETEQKKHLDQKKTIPMNDWSFAEALQAAEFPNGRWPGARHPTASETKNSLGIFDCPGDAVRIRLSQLPDFNPGDPMFLWPPLDDKDFAAGSSWTCLYLLHGDNVSRDPDGRTWYVELPVLGKGSFVMKLEFDVKVGIPETDNWPGKAGR
jgi:hypothetical protein